MSNGEASKAMAPKGARTASSSVRLPGARLTGSAVIRESYIARGIGPPVPMGQSSEPAEATVPHIRGSRLTRSGDPLWDLASVQAAVGSEKQKRAPPSWRFSAQI